MSCSARKRECSSSFPRSRIACGRENQVTRHLDERGRQKCTRSFRSYSGQGVSELFDLLEQRHEELKSLFIDGVPGLFSYWALRSSADGGITMTVCHDEAGTDESSRQAAEWVAENVSSPVNQPLVTEGSIVLHFNS